MALEKTGLELGVRCEECKYTNIHKGTARAHEPQVRPRAGMAGPPRLGRALPGAPVARGLGMGFLLFGDLDRLRESTGTGRPFGTKDFVAELEAKLERNLEPQKRDRKPEPMTNAASPGESPTDRLPDGCDKG